MHDARNIANELLELAASQGQGIMAPELMDMVCLAHGFMLAMHHRILVCQPLEAWQEGPVIPELHRCLRPFGEGPVTRRLQGNVRRPLDAQEQQAIRAALAAARTAGSERLARVLRARGSPWNRQWKSRMGTSVEIPEREIREFHHKMIQAASRRQSRKPRARKEAAR